MIAKDFKLEGKDLEKIDDSVTAYQQNRTDENFVELYSALGVTMKKCFGRLRKALPAVVSNDDILGLIDDAVLSCIDKFDQQKGCSFVTFFCREIEDRRKDHVRHLNAEKRQADLTAVPLDAKLDNDTETTLVDMLTDDTATDAEDVLVAEGILDSLRAFRESSEKNKVHASLVAFDAVYFETREEKHAAMRQLLGKDISTSGLHKKVKKAKIAFREFLGENN